MKLINVAALAVLGFTAVTAVAQTQNFCALGTRPLRLDKNLVTCTRDVPGKTPNCPAGQAPAAAEAGCFPVNDHPDLKSPWSPEGDGARCRGGYWTGEPGHYRCVPK